MLGLLCGVEKKKPYKFKEIVCTSLRLWVFVAHLQVGRKY